MGKNCCGKNGPRQGPNGSQYNEQTGGKQCVTGSHREDVCHGTNERRRDLMDQLKIFLEEFDDRPCPSPPPKTGGPLKPLGESPEYLKKQRPCPSPPPKTGGPLKPLGEYPEYLKKHCQSWMPDPQPPTITSNGTHEVRVTSEYERAKKEQSEYVSYVDARSKKPIPPSCECARRNGLQDQCSRPECNPPTPQCLATNPGPCCPPSLGMTGQEAAEKAAARGRTPQTTYRQDFQQHPADSQREAFSSTYGQDYCPPSPSPWQVRDDRGGQREAVAVGVYRTVYKKDGGTPEGSTSPNVSRSLPTSSPRSSGQQMICFCSKPPSSMPAGKKYLCCPLPE